MFAEDNFSVPESALVSVLAPEIAPLISPVFPDATLTFVAESSTTTPDNVAVSEKYTAPLVADVPLTVRGSDELRAPVPATSSVAPALTVVPVLALPSADEFEIFNVPLLIVVAPV